MRYLHCGQKVSLTLGERHLSKDGTPTIGGLIFIIPTVISILLLLLFLAMSAACGSSWGRDRTQATEVTPNP